jgi:hypothetical protein
MHANGDLVGFAQLAFDLDEINLHGLCLFRNDPSHLTLVFGQDALCLRHMIRALSFLMK